MQSRSCLCAVLVAAVVGWSAVASAQQELKLDQVGAALAFPLISGAGLTTYDTVTNVGPSDRNLHFNVIDGAGWGVTDFDCPVTASETVLITFRSAGNGLSILELECNLATGAEISISRVVTSNGGVLFVALETHECKNGTCTTNANDLLGDFAIIDASQGSAYGGGAIPFQGMDALAPGVADREYLFDNVEYSMFPSTLATNFIAPGPSIGGVVTADLVLFLLDGRAAIGSQAALDVVFYDDDETPTSAHYSFGCFSIVPLAGIDPNFAAPLLGSEVGHLYITAIDADQISNVHDNKFGNGNAIRVVGVHGWLVQSIHDPSLAGDTAGTAAWSRSLAQGMMAQDVDGSDVPAFDGL